MVSEPPWVNQTSGTEARNGTTSHTISFGFTSTTGNFLVFVIHGAVTHTVSGWTERLQPVGSGELSVFTKTSAAESSITVTHNGSDYPVAWSAYEFPSGTTWVAGVDNSLNSDTFPQLTGLPGTEVVVFGGRGRAAAAADSPTGASSTVSDPWVEDADQFAAENNVTDGCYLYVTHQINVTATSITPTATTTYTGSWGAIPDRQHVTFALDVPAAAVVDTIVGPYAGRAPGRISPTGRFSPWSGVADVPATAISLDDTAAADDAASVAVTITDSDTGSAADAATVSAAITLSDTAAASDAISVDTGATPISLTDTAAATDAVTVAAQAPMADTATAADALSVFVQAALTESAAALDALGITAAITLADTGSGAETLSVDTGGAKTLPETASAADRLRVTLIRPNTGTVSRPSTGTITRPNTGVVQRP